MSASVQAIVSELQLVMKNFEERYTSVKNIVDANVRDLQKAAAATDVPTSPAYALRTLGRIDQLCDILMNIVTDLQTQVQDIKPAKEDEPQSEAQRPVAHSPIISNA